VREVRSLGPVGGYVIFNVLPEGAYVEVEVRVGLLRDGQGRWRSAR